MRFTEFSFGLFRVASTFMYFTYFSLSFLGEVLAPIPMFLTFLRFTEFSPYLFRGFFAPIRVFLTFQGFTYFTLMLLREGSTFLCFTYFTLSFLGVFLTPKMVFLTFLCLSARGVYFLFLLGWSLLSGMGFSRHCDRSVCFMESLLAILVPETGDCASRSQPCISVFW